METTAPERWTRSFRLLNDDVAKALRGNSLGALVQELRAHLDAAIAATTEDAVVRTGKTFCLTRVPKQEVTRPEDQWERGLYFQFRGAGRPTGAFLPACPEIVACQVPLNDARGDGWGDIDLVGLSGEGLPVVIELKVKQADYNLLSIILQGAAYAVSLRKTWNNEGGALRDEWQQAFSSWGLAEPETLPLCLVRCPVIIAGPADFWQDQFRRFAAAGDEIVALLTDLEQRGLPVSFAVLDGLGAEDGGLRARGIAPFAPEDLG